MDEQRSFDELVARLRRRDDEAATRVFNRYARRLVTLARSRLALAVRQKVDPEDVMQSVFRSFFIRHAEGHIDVRDWDGMWSILMVITLRKCVNQGKFFHRARRDVAREAAPPPAPDESSPRWDYLDTEPRPDEAAMLAETVHELMDTLSSRDREILTLALQGHTAREISAQVDYSERTVHRTLQHIREHLQRLRDEGENG